MPPIIIMLNSLNVAEKRKLIISKMGILISRKMMNRTKMKVIKKRFKHLIPFQL